ncbi:MAG: TAXI family TRAP transporter solute-binding subunit [Candidatus Atribacteria bacterium]|nr:TAXI family TRAP transporter solute-binding subunit [Candidatus Atribacteria bacterium]
MKKSVHLFIILLTVIFFTGTNSLAQTTYLTATGGTMGGSTYVIAAAISKIITDSLDGVVCGVQSTGGTVAQLQLLKRQESQIGTCDPAATDAFNGVGAYIDDPMPFLRAIAPMYPELKAVIVAKDSGIKSIYELKGKRVSIGAVASGTELTNKETFSVLGMTFDDIDARYLGSNESAQAFKDRQIDACLMTATDPAVIEMTSLDLVEILPVDEEFLRKLKEAYPKYSSAIIPAGLLKGIEKDVPTFAFWNAVITREEQPEDLIYNITSALYDNSEDLVNTSVLMKTMIPENIKELTIPLHPGAKRYYVEKGYSEYFNKDVEK